MAEIAGTAIAGWVISAAAATMSATSSYVEHKDQSKAARAAKDSNEQAVKEAKDRASELKEASAKNSNMFNDAEKTDQKSLLDAQKKSRLARSGAAGTRLTGGKLGSPSTIGGATLLGQ